MMISASDPNRDAKVADAVTRVSVPDHVPARCGTCFDERAELRHDQQPVGAPALRETPCLSFKTPCKTLVPAGPAAQGGPAPALRRTAVASHRIRRLQARSSRPTKTNSANMVKVMPPQMRDAYQRVVVAGKKMMYAPETAEAIQGIILDDEVPMPNKLGEGVANLVVMMDNQGNGTIPKDILVPVGVTLMFEAADHLFEVGDGSHREGPSDGMELMVYSIFAAYGVPEEEVNKTIDKLMVISISTKRPSRSWSAASRNASRLTWKRLKVRQVKKLNSTPGLQPSRTSGGCNHGLVSDWNSGAVGRLPATRLKSGQKSGLFEEAKVLMMSAPWLARKTQPAIRTNSPVRAKSGFKR